MVILFWVLWTYVYGEKEDIWGCSIFFVPPPPKDKRDIQKINNLRVINDIFPSSSETHLITHHSINNNLLMML